MSEGSPLEPRFACRWPLGGLRAGDVVLRLPSIGGVDAILPAFTDPELDP